MEVVLLNGFLICWCFYVYWGIHFRRLDYSRDVSFFGFGVTVNERSRIHLAIGILAGMLWSVHGNTPCLLSGSALILLYTARNFKHLRILNSGFAVLGKPSPGIWRSSMMRQQMQMHMGLGVGGLLASAEVFLSTRPIDPTHWPLRALCMCSLVLGAFTLCLPPVPEDAKREFVDVRFDPAQAGMKSREHKTV
eukprot:TRINITY_DN65447_c0_g1_i1.p1 TRINITY_DN65447_c0_g1~~TRINITY_DN65447_c0_g1_i1.p1  ORF type:complete len:193 (-),score=17.14 TRINITY_DN65447_c0_g1_i1:21-599(-)